MARRRAELFVGELQNFGHESAGGNGDAACAEAEAPTGVDDDQRADQRVVIGQRFAHAHDNDVVERSQLGARARRARILAVADLQELGDDLAGVQVAFEAGEPARAKHAGHGAADLGGDTDGFARMVEAYAFLWRADDDGFNERAVAQLKEQFVGDVVRLLVEDERGGHQVEGLVKPGAQRFRKVGHVVP